MLPRIVKAEVCAVAQDPPEYAWSPVMPEVLNTDTLLRLEDESGAVGYGAVCTFTEYGADGAVLAALRPLLLGLMRRDEMCPEAHWAWMAERRPGVSNPAIAAVDIALWDLAAKHANQPLHALLGGTRKTIPAYASVPVMDHPEQYIALISELRDQGFHTFKFHYKSVPEIDIALIHAVHEAFAEQGLGFMFDAEGQYDAAGGLAVAEVMSELGHVWLEAPFDDHDFTAYRALKEAVSVPVIPAGNSVVDPAHLAQAIDAKCWSALRLDAATAGGITPTRAMFTQAQAAGLKLELQSWGSSFSTAANLHLALAHDNSTYFEVPVPRGDFVVPGTSAFKVTEAGEIAAPQVPGLGLEVDWNAVRAAADLSVSFERESAQS